MASFGLDATLYARPRISALVVLTVAAAAVLCAADTPAAALAAKKELRPAGATGEFDHQTDAARPLQRGRWAGNGPLHASPLDLHVRTKSGGREQARLVAAPPRVARLRFHLVRTGRKLGVAVRVLRGEGRVLVRVRRSDGRAATRTAIGHEGSLWRYRFRLPTRGSWLVTIRLRPDPGWTGVLVRARPFTVRR